MESKPANELEGLIRDKLLWELEALSWSVWKKGHGRSRCPNIFESALRRSSSEGGFASIDDLVGGHRLPFHFVAAQETMSAQGHQQTSRVTSVSCPLFPSKRTCQPQFASAHATNGSPRARLHRCV